MNDILFRTSSTDDFDSFQRDVWLRTAELKSLAYVEASTFKIH